MSTKPITGKFIPLPKKKNEDQCGLIKCIFNEDPQKREPLAAWHPSKPRTALFSARKLNNLKGVVVAVIINETEKAIIENEVYTVRRTMPSGRREWFETGGIFLTPITE